MHARLAQRLGLTLLLPFAAFAQEMPAPIPVPAPEEFYFDEDAATTQPVVALEGDPVDVERLVRLMERGGRDADEATAQLAHLAMTSGREETGDRLYRRLLGELTPRSTLGHAVRWNYAWDLYRSGDPRAALRQWLAAFEGRLTRPDWVPTTLALALWRLDRREEALDWYAAAVRTHPGRWRDPELASLLPDWREDERALLAEVHAAWKQAPPSWP